MTKSTKKSRVKKIGNYEIIKTLGEGSYGKVKLAVHEQTGEKVALKIIKYSHYTTGAQTQRGLQLIHREQTLLQQLNHPNIVQLLEVIELPESQATCLVMEYMKGGDLFDYIRKKSNGIKESSAARMLFQILTALQYIHSKLIIHRDIKAENLLLDEKGNIKLCDFGLCNSMTLGSYMKSRCGSPLYAAPEILSGCYYIGPEVDVWSTGVIFYVMVSASLPWPGDNVAEWTANAKTGNYIPLTSISPECANLLSRMLVVDPKRRATVAELLSHPFLLKHGCGTGSNLEDRLVTDLDDEILHKLEHLGFTKEQVIEDVIGKNKISQAYLLYHLLEKEKYAPNEEDTSSNSRKNSVVEKEDGSKESKKKRRDSTAQKKEILEAICRKKKELKEKEKALKETKKSVVKMGVPHTNTLIRGEREVNEIKKMIAEMDKVRKMTRSTSEDGLIAKAESKKTGRIFKLFKRNSDL